MSVRSTTDPDLSGPCCGTCLYYTVMGGQGACRRYPPLPVAVGQGITAFFPPVGLQHWCGEYQPKREGMAS